ncbi:MULTISPECIES: helix-turn-helix transcriptional regulator [Pseudoalteromonas]|uniref:Helix-turn-helix transcriptional regulator n=1 Tax=Pseudoalteromonas obscura TaxID=3048491 RepID=A0ABT7EK50_9GAMM|nr:MULTISPECIES: helix-turn-helix transcriptional regulator [Pseudoalteromonas]MDK2595435.1 helix-turn-helix transcriptional regulator [Pseudoalteromonas sp. P94(2023)]
MVSRFMRHDAVRRRLVINKLMVEMQNNLRSTRKSNNLTQKQLGDKLNVDQATISNFETGKTYMTMELVYEMYLIFGDEFCLPNIQYFERK